jgi:hypothetical protein
LLWLNALLAFTLAMIIFCTIVSAITETIQHFFQLRRRGLEQMLGKLYADVIRPRAGSVSQDAWVQQLISNLGVPPGRLMNWILPTKLDALTTTEFVRRVAESELGPRILALGDADANRFIDALAVRFERSGNDARDYFAQRAQTFSLLIAIVLAFTLNVDAFRLFSAFLTDKELTNRILAQQEAIAAPLRPNGIGTETERSTGAETAGVAAAVTATPSATETPTAAPAEAPAAGGDAAAPGGPSDPGSAAGAAPFDQLRNSARAALQMLQQSTAMGLPIGASYFPYCVNGADGPDRLCRQSNLAWWYYGGWVLSTLLAGFLIGLGGPFWYNAFTHLSGIIELARSATGHGKSGAGAPNEDTSPPPPPGSPAEVFRAALAAAAASATPPVPPSSPGAADSATRDDR